MENYLKVCFKFFETTILVDIIFKLAEVFHLSCQSALKHYIVEKCVLNRLRFPLLVAVSDESRSKAGVSREFSEWVSAPPHTAQYTQPSA